AVNFLFHPLCRDLRGTTSSGRPTVTVKLLDRGGGIAPDAVSDEGCGQLPARLHPLHSLCRATPAFGQLRAAEQLLGLGPVSSVCFAHCFSPNRFRPWARADASALPIE